MRRQRQPELTLAELVAVAHGFGISRWRDEAELRAKVEAWPMNESSKPTPIGTLAPTVYSTRFTKPPPNPEEPLRCPECVRAPADAPRCTVCLGVRYVDRHVFAEWWAARNGRPK